MPISKIKSGAINDDAITNAKLADDAVNSAEIADNVELSGTEAARMPVGTTAQRANAQSGDIRFNSNLSLMEYYDGTLWKAIDSPPTISSISPSTFSATGDTITVSGSNFQTGVNVTLIASDGTTYTPDSVTRVSSSSITFDISSSISADEADPWDVKVENSSGLAVTSNDALTLAGTISLNTAAGSLGTVYDTQRSSLSYNLGVTDSSSESDVSFTYSVSSGALPGGLSLNTSTGAVTGTATAVGSDTTSNFTITYVGADASDSSYAPTAGTAYSLTIAAPVITSYTSIASGTFTVPSGISAVDVLVVAGGGAGARYTSGGGGGLIYRPAFPVTPGGTVSYTVGGGGTSGNEQGSTSGTKGSDSVFGTLTAQGGGAGKYHGTGGGSAVFQPISNGGSGAGGDSNPGSAPNSTAGTGTQPQAPGDSGTYGFGNPGGVGGNNAPSYNGGGGGGAGAAGGAVNPSGPNAGQGGAGKQYDISGTQTYYAGGGGGSHYTGGGNAASQDRGGQGGQGGGGNGAQALAPNTGQVSNLGSSEGTANRGGGGGGGGLGNGGSGIVIVKY